MLQFVGTETKENMNRLTGVVLWYVGGTFINPPPPPFFDSPLVFFPPSLQRWNENSWSSVKLLSKFKNSSLPTTEE